MQGGDWLAEDDDDDDDDDGLMPFEYVDTA